MRGKAGPLPASPAHNVQVVWPGMWKAFSQKQGRDTSLRVTFEEEAPTGVDSIKLKLPDSVYSSLLVTLDLSPCNLQSEMST